MKGGNKEINVVTLIGFAQNIDDCKNTITVEDVMNRERAPPPYWHSEVKYDEEKSACQQNGESMSQRLDRNREYTFVYYIALRCIKYEIIEYHTLV